jgi:hypothetical protein
MDTMAADAQADKGEDASEPSTLFLLPAPSAADPIAAALNPDTHVDALGRTIGQAGWTVASAAAGFAGRAAVEYMKQPRKPRSNAGWGSPNTFKTAGSSGLTVRRPLCWFLPGTVVMRLATVTLHKAACRLPTIHH